MFVIPRTGARLTKALADLPLVLRYAAVVDAAIRGTVRLDAAMIGAA
jgi:hypothetical protein